MKPRSPALGSSVPTHAVPFVSQQAYRNPDWRPFGCGIASLKMVFDFWHQQDPRNPTADADDLYAAGLAAGAFNPDFGWIHAGLVGLAASRGYESYNVDFGPRSRTPRSTEEALGELSRELEQGPVIASVYRSYDPAQGGGHLVVVTDAAEDALHVNDPEPEHESHGRRVLSRSHFMPAFKHRFIVVRPAPRRAIPPRRRPD